MIDYDLMTTEQQAEAEITAVAIDEAINQEQANDAFPVADEDYFDFDDFEDEELIAELEDSFPAA